MPVDELLIYKNGEESTWREAKSYSVFSQSSGLTFFSDGNWVAEIVYSDSFIPGLHFG